jgi:hypothetical protein
MNVEMRTEVAQFPEKEYINGVFVAVHVQPSEPNPKGIINSIDIYCSGVFYFFAIGYTNNPYLFNQWTSPYRKYLFGRSAFACSAWFI